MEYELIGAVATVGGTAYAGWAKLINPYLRKERKKKNEMLEKINSIHGELKFNGGSSLKDAIFDLKDTTQKINFRLGAIEENIRVSMNLQGVAFWSSNQDGECVYASPALCKIMGRTESEILGNNWVAWIVAEDKERVFNAWKFSVENKTPFDEIYTYHRSDGTEIKVWGLAFHKIGIDGSHLGTLGKLEISE